MKQFVSEAVGAYLHYGKMEVIWPDIFSPTTRHGINKLMAKAGNTLTFKYKILAAVIAAYL